MRNFMIGCLGMIVLVLVVLLLLFVNRARQEPQAQSAPQPQPVAQQQPPVVQPQSSGQASAPTQPVIRIVSPANGARVRVGQPFQVHVIANDPGGVASIAYALDGQQGSPVAASSTQVFETAIPITAPSQGIHAIAVQANNAGGAKSQPAVIRVVAVQSLSDPTNSGDPPAPIPDVPTDPVSSDGQQQAPSGATVNFAANPTSIAQGQCSTLRWDVEGVREIYFEGVGVTGHEQQQECPTQTTTYTLGVVFQDGSARNYTAQVAVTAAVVVVGKPDLVITDAHLEPAEATAGQPFNAVFAIANRGDVPSGPFTVFWQFHEATGLKNCCSREFTNGIAAKGWGGGTFPNLVTNSRAGTSPSWVEIDYGNRVDEGAAGETNNKISLTLTVKAGASATTEKPDLMIDNVQVTPTSEPGKVNVIITYSNHNNAPVTSGFTIRWYPHEGSNVVGCSRDVDAATARAGSWAGIVCPYTYAERGEMHWRAVVDADNDVAESNDNNNEKKGAVTIAGAAAAFAATNATISVNRSTYSGPCPNTFTAGSKITANGAGTVKYRWERSDGINSQTQTLQFDTAGEKSVTNVDWAIPSSGNYWMRLHILEPNDLSSNKGETVFTCTNAASAFQVTGVTADVDPKIFSGACPKSITYSGTITTNGPGTVTYKWVRSDGESETRTINFTAAGSRTVTSSNVTYNQSATHWAKLQVTAPNAMISDQAKFTLSCVSPAIVTLVSVNVNPTSFTGTCPHTFHFNGTIRVNAPGTVTYRWERSDGTSDTRTMQFSAAGDKTIESGDFKSGSSGTFWARLHVLTPNDKTSNQATFTLTCK